MLKGLKKGPKKEGKADTKGKAAKQQTQQLQDGETQENEDLLDHSKQELAKGKQQYGRKKDDYKLQEKQIDYSNIQLPTKKVEAPKPEKFMAVNTIEEAMGKKDFKIEAIDHQFISLTDQSLNQKLLIKQKQQEQKQKNATVAFQNNLHVQRLEKTAQQLKMQKADQVQFKRTSVASGISTTATAINFTNSNMNQFSQPLQKTPQQLKMEEAERRQQEIAAKKPTTSWIGTNKPTGQQQKPIVFKPSPWVTMATQNQDKPAGEGLKFAPLNSDNTQKQPSKNQEVTVTKKPQQSEGQKKQTPSVWTASSIVQQNGIKFAPLQVSKQDQKLMNNQRKEQEFVFVSKQERQRRKKIKEEKEQKAKQTPNN